MENRDVAWTELSSMSQQNFDHVQQSLIENCEVSGPNNILSHFEFFVFYLTIDLCCQMKINSFTLYTFNSSQSVGEKISNNFIYIYEKSEKEITARGRWFPVPDGKIKRVYTVK